MGSSGAYYIIYFLFIIFFGSFYLINLVLAVVAISYEQEVLSPQEEKVIVSLRKVLHANFIKLCSENMLLAVNCTPLIDVDITEPYPLRLLPQNYLT